MLESAESVEFLLTHCLVPAGPIPTTHDPDGIYPYESFCETSRRPEIRKYRMVRIENDRISAKICPDLGGRVCSLFLKESGVETLFFPPVIRPVRAHLNGCACELLPDFMILGLFSACLPHISEPEGMGVRDP